MEDTQDTLTWERMIELDPELEDFRIEFHEWARKNRSPHLDNLAWSQRVKPRISGLVGWSSWKWPLGHIMTSPRAFDLAHHEIYEKAPITWGKKKKK